MARHVTGLSQNFLTTPYITPALPFPFTISCRFKLDSAHTAGYHLMGYGELGATYDCDYIAEGVSGNNQLVAYSGRLPSFYGAFVNVTLVPGQWYLAVAVYESASKRTLYVDNVASKITDTSASSALILGSKRVSLGGVVVDNTPTCYAGAGFNGEVADAAIWNTALVDADVTDFATKRPGSIKPANLQGWWKLGSDGSLANSAPTSYPAMTVIGSVPATADPTLPAESTDDPDHVPSSYTMNTDLSWVTKATHIWALHPSNPTKADKGGLTLEAVVGSSGPATVTPENTIELHGGAAGVASYYRSLSTFLFGDDPNTAGNQTPPVIGAISFWIKPYSLAIGGNTRVIGPPAIQSPLPILQFTASQTAWSVQSTTISNTYPVLNQWTHVCGTNDGSFRRIYINGVKVGESTNVTALASPPFQIHIGLTGTAGPTSIGVDGQLRLVAVTNGVVWTDAEIAEQASRPYAYYKSPLRLKSRPVYSPRSFEPIAATDAEAPCRESLVEWYPGTRPFTDIWSNISGDSSATISTPTAASDHWVERADNASGVPYGKRASFTNPNGYSPLSYGDVQVYSFWIRYHGFKYTAPYWDGNVVLYGAATWGATTIIAYLTNSTLDAYGYPSGMIEFTRLNYYAQSSCFSQVGIPLDTWTHVTIVCRTPDADSGVDFYYNGEKVFTGSQILRPDLPWSNPTYSVFNPEYGDYGDYSLKDFRIYSARLTAAQVRDIYEHSLAFHRATSGLVDTAIRPVQIEYVPDPTHVPDTYVPNTELTWVQRATHIWAVHPANPLKADKGGMVLGAAGTGTPPTALASPENTMEFHGGFDNAASYYKTSDTFVFGDDPLIAGNNTPPVIGAMSGWVYFNSLQNYSNLFGQGISTAVASFEHVAFVFNTGGGLMAGHIHGGGFFFLGGTTTGVWMHVCITNDATFQRLYINGVKVVEQAQTGSVGAAEPMMIGQMLWSGNNFGLNGRIRLVSVINGAVWTDAEILEQYQRPYAYYAPVPPLVGIQAEAGAFALAGQPATLKVGRRMTAASGAFGLIGQPVALRAARKLIGEAGAYKLAGDNLSEVGGGGVPATYTPNLSLPWVTKATHIWAVHPSDPLKADKGGLGLELVTGVSPVPSVVADNTMEFHGGLTTDASYYRTLGSFVWGDDPTIAGNQTPPAIGGISCWVYLNTNNPGPYRFVVGGKESAGMLFGFTFSVQPNRLIFNLNGTIQPPSVTTLSLGTWHHICATNDGTLQRIYKNGVKITEQPSTATTVPSEIMQIGACVRALGGTHYGMDGRIRLVASVSGQVWTDAEILDQYQNPYAYYVTPRWETILRYGRKLIGETGVFALDGQPVDLKTTRYLQAGGGEFLLTGYDAELKHWMPIQGSGRIFYVAKDDRIVYIPSDIDIREGE